MGEGSDYFSTEEVDCLAAEAAALTPEGQLRKLYHSASPPPPEQETDGEQHKDSPCGSPYKAATVW